MATRLSAGKYYGVSLEREATELYSLSITDYKTGAILPQHYHENTYISILIRGNYFEKNRAVNMLIQPGDVLVRPSKYLHKNIFEKEGGRCFNIEFSQAWEPAIFYQLNQSSLDRPLKTRENASIYKLYAAFFSGNATIDTLELICDWLSQVKLADPNCDSVPWVTKIKDILESEPETFHTLASLSSRVFVHPVYLSGSFKKRTGLTIGEYQLNVKLAKAMKLLLKTDYAINTIAAMAGFYDVAHFSNIFKCKHKFSPNQFRKLQKS